MLPFVLVVFGDILVAWPVFVVTSEALSWGIWGALAQAAATGCSQSYGLFRASTFTINNGGH